MSQVIEYQQPNDSQQILQQGQNNNQNPSNNQQSNNSQQSSQQGQDNNQNPSNNQQQNNSQFTQLCKQKIYKIISIFQKSEVEKDSTSQIDFLLKDLPKQELQQDVKTIIKEFRNQYEKKYPEKLIRSWNKNSLLCCFFGGTREQADFYTSTGKSLTGNIEKKRYYGNIYFDNLRYQDNVDLNSDYQYGKRCGFGVEVEIDKDKEETKIYIGEFFNNKYHGKGILLEEFPIAEKYKKYMFGDIFQGLILKEDEGKAEEFFAGVKQETILSFLKQKPDGSVSSQAFFQDYPFNSNESQVQDKQNDKGIYAGQLSKEKKREGWGEMKFKNGNSYLGQWKNDKMHGTGRFKWRNGEEYLGEYFMGQKHGFGRYKYLQGKEYIGQFKNGEYHGLAIWKNNITLNKQTEWQYGVLKKF